MNWSALDWGILGPALVAGLLVLATHVSLGARVLDKGIVFIDLAIAQIAGLGVIGADALGLPEGGVAVQAAAVTAALAGALLLTWTEKTWPETQEALIGVMFVLASCAGILMLSDNPHGGEHLKDLLVGQILWVGKTQILWLARSRRCWAGDAHRPDRPARPLRLLCDVRDRRDGVGAAGGRLPGLHEPDRAGAGHARDAGRARFIAGYAVGAIGYAVGLALSALLDLPSGAVIVWVLAVTAVVFGSSRAAA